MAYPLSPGYLKEKLTIFQAFGAGSGTLGHPILHDGLTFELEKKKDKYAHKQFFPNENDKRMFYRLV